MNFPANRLWSFPGARLFFQETWFGFAFWSVIWGLCLLVPSVAAMFLFTRHQSNDGFAALYPAVIVILSLPALLGVLGVLLGLLMFVVAAGSLTVWSVSTAVARARYRRIMRVQGWTGVVLSPMLTSFSERAWRQLPTYEDFLMTNWCGRWYEGRIAALNLHAALALLEERHIDWNGEYDGRKQATERTDEVAAELLRKRK